MLLNLSMNYMLRASMPHVLDLPGPALDTQLCICHDACMHACMHTNGHFTEWALQGNQSSVMNYADLLILYKDNKLA